MVERSHCPHCKHQLSWYENIPVFSWLVLRGKCRHCKAPISMQYPAVELLTMLLFVACVWRFGFGWKGFGAVVFTGLLISMSGIDLQHETAAGQPDAAADVAGPDRGGRQSVLLAEAGACWAPSRAI